MKLSDRDIEMIKKYGKLAEDDELVEMILEANLANNEKALEYLQKGLLYEATPHIINPDPYYPYPKQADLNGDLELGLTKNGLIWRINRDELCKNFFGGGIVGAGKTNTSFGFVKKLSHSNIRVLSFGIKQDTRHMACKEVPMVVLRCSRNTNFRLGDIFDAPDGTDEIDYQTEVIKSFAVTTFIGESGKALLLEAVTTLRAKQGYVDLPSLISYLKRMKCRSKREADWLSTLVNRLTEFYIKFGPLLSGKKCFPIERVIERVDVETELDGAGEFRHFFPALFEMRIFKYRIANNIRGNRLRTAIICDEVNMLASKKIEMHAAALGCIPTLLEFMPLCREFGIGHILFSNQPTEVSNVLKAQAGIKMSLRLGNWPDIFDMGNNMTLNTEQMQVIVDLPPGQAVVKMPGVSPFLVQMPLIEVEKNTNNVDIDANNRRLLKDTEWEEFLDIDEKNKPIVPESSEVEKIDELERAFLFDVLNRPDVGLTDRYKSIGLSIGRGDRLTSLVSSKDLVRMHEINLSGRGAKTKFLELTKKGYQAIGIDLRAGISKGGGFLHELIQKRVAEALKRIPEIERVSIEERFLHKTVDIVVEICDGKRIAVEIAMSASNEINNIQKDINVECDYIIIVCRDKNVMKKVNDGIAKLDDSEKCKVEVCLIYQILKCKTLGDLISWKK